MKPIDDLPKIYKGNNAQSIAEMVKETCLSEGSIRRFAKEQVKAGKWKQVLVKKGRNICAAYVKIK